MNQDVPDVIVETDVNYQDLRIAILADLIDLLPKDGSLGSFVATYRSVLDCVLEATDGEDDFAKETSVAIAQRTAFRYLYNWVDSELARPESTPNVLVESPGNRFVERCLQAEIRCALQREGDRAELERVVAEALADAVDGIMTSPQRFRTEAERETAVAVAMRTADSMKQA
ncbi:hypothetical protein [Singulisphaera sp. PoT]|uniref:hypothetical protein n=1 Tax=Singulisphaera sp. PoT TaxID=3411797 RepID=UPI003BF57EB9